MNIRLLSLAVLSLMLVGCASLTEEQSAITSQGIYAVGDAINNGRIELAKKYIAQAKRFIAPPKDKINISPFIARDNPKSTQQFVILPTSLSGLPVVVEGSKEFIDVLARNKQLQEQLTKEQNDAQQYKADVEKLLREKEEALRKLQEEKEANKSSWWWTALKWITPIGAAGIIVLCIFNPAIAVAVGGIIADIFGIVLSVFKNILDLIQKVIAWKKSPPKT